MSKTSLKKMEFSIPENLNLEIKEFNSPQKVIFGADSYMRLSSFIPKGTKKIILFTHEIGKFTSTGIIDEIISNLSKASFVVKNYGISNTPSTQSIDELTKEASLFSPDLVLCIGGGSVIDGGKLIAALINNPGKSQDYQDSKCLILEKPVDIFAVPTTSGSGSEATAVSVLKNSTNGCIKSISSPFLIPKYVLLDPSFIKFMPPSLLALVGLDAFTHAMESFVSKKANLITRQNSLLGGRLIYESLPRVINGQGNDLDYEKLILGSYFSGLGLNAGVGAAHILAQPISAVLGTSHGQSLSFVLKEVVKFNEAENANLYNEFIEELTNHENKSSAKMTQFIADFMENIGLDTKLGEFTSERNVPLFLEQVAMSTSHIWTNPRDVKMNDLERILLNSL